MGRIPLGIQVGAVATLFTAALIALWWAGASVFRREDRRRVAVREVERAAAQLAERGAPGLALVPTWPETLRPAAWEALDEWLSLQADQAWRDHPGVMGGYYVPSDDLYLGRVTQPPAPREPYPFVSALPAGDLDLIDRRVREALRTERPSAVLLESPDGAVAVRAAPVWVNGRKVAATWALLRLDDGPTLVQALDRYRLAADLALIGILLALILTLNLARTIRRQRTERERLQRELRRSERLAALGKLLAGVAHEIRNPLTGIRSTAQLWQRGVEPDSEMIADVIAEVDRLEGLVSRLLQFSRADCLDLHSDDLNVVVAEAARLARSSTDPRGIEVRVELDRTLPQVPMAAPALLQLLRNLTANAAQAMSHGGTLTLKTRRDPSGRAVIAEVQDTGPGLSPEALAHLFEPFFTTKADGTGLGLAIAREIALAHHGELHAANRRDALGAVFSLILPVST
jgi:signal transduction histidine kinase